MEFLYSIAVSLQQNDFNLRNPLNPVICDYNLPDNSLPALKRATFLALILITSPVCGLRPLRAARLETEKVPKPTSVTLSPFFKVLVTASTKASMAVFACVFVMPDSSAICAINSALFIVIHLKIVCDKFIRFLSAAKFFHRLQRLSTMRGNPRRVRVFKDFSLSKIFKYPRPLR